MDKIFYFLAKQYLYAAIIILLLIQFSSPLGGLETDELIKKYFAAYLATLFSLLIIISTGYLKTKNVIRKIQQNKVYKIIDVILFNLLLMLFISETTLAIFSMFSTAPLFAMNPWTTSWIEHVRPPPYTDLSAGMVNGEGYLDTEFSETKDNNTYRIIALGDSFSFGDDYKYVHYTLLESFLNKHSKGTKYEIYNMGVGATDPNHYYQIYKESLKYKPDLVIMTLYVGNDFTMELFGRSSNIFKRSSWYTYTFFRRLYSLYLNLYKKENTDNIYYALSRNKGLPLLPQDGTTLPSENEVIKVAKKNMGNKKLGEVNLSNVLPLYSQPAYREVQKTWGKNKIKTHFYEIMEIINKIHKEMNGRFVLFIAPDIIQIDDRVQDLFYDYLETDLAHLGEDKHDYNFTTINNKITEYCTRNSIHCIDLLPPLRKGRTIYYVNEDGVGLHWNEYGHYIAAREEYNAISSSRKELTQTD